MTVPQKYQYTSEHEWLDIDGSRATVGVTAFAADALGDVVHVELPETGTLLKAGESCGELESTKSVSDLYAPADGVVVETNDAVVHDPSLLNSDPFGAGWLIRMELTGTYELLSSEAYETLTREA